MGCLNVLNSGDGTGDEGQQAVAKRRGISSDHRAGRRQGMNGSLSRPAERTSISRITLVAVFTSKVAICATQS